MEPEVSLPFSKEPCTGPYHEPDQSSPHHSILSLRFILILSTPIRLSLRSGLFPFGFPTNILYSFYMPCPSHFNILQCVKLKVRVVFF
jgi:hypothetical protein